MPDEAVQNFAIVNSKGEVLFEFAGVIKAEGLTLPEATAEEGTSKNKVGWTNADTTIREFIQGAHYINGLGEGNSALQASVNNLQKTQAGTFTQVAWNNELENAFIQLIAGKKYATISIGALANLRTLLASGGSSDFAQLAVFAKRKIAFGTTEVEFPGGSTLSNAVKVSHGLGAKPIIALALCDGFNPNSTTEVTNRTETTFETRLQFTAFTPAKGAKATIMWLAIG